MIKAVEYVPPHKEPGEECPFTLITGRTLYHFHTRTKTGRAPEFQRAAPEVWVEVRSPRGGIRARVSGIRRRGSRLVVSACPKSCWKSL